MEQGNEGKVAASPWEQLWLFPPLPSGEPAQVTRLCLQEWETGAAPGLDRLLVDLKEHGGTCLSAFPLFGCIFGGFFTCLAGNLQNPKGGGNMCQNL